LTDVAGDHVRWWRADVKLRVEEWGPNIREGEDPEPWINYEHEELLQFRGYIRLDESNKACIRGQLGDMPDDALAVWTYDSGWPLPGGGGVANHVAVAGGSMLVTPCET
jgi:hypothetical protein